MTAYYNEIDPYCVEWLRNLIREGLIADGQIDDRSISDVTPNDLRSFTQCHFFAGLGGWSGALRLAAWPDNREVWTGSCPCQPFSVTGRQGGFADERHLWPQWHYLIQVCRPAVILGEQVASAAQWLGLVRGDLEALDYAVGAIPVEAASAGADHLRDRYWFVGHDTRVGWREGRPEHAIRGGWSAVAGSSGVGLADANDTGSQGRQLLPERADQRLAGTDGLANSDSRAIRHEPGRGSGTSWSGSGIDRDDRQIDVEHASIITEREPNYQSNTIADGRQARPILSGAGDYEWVIGADGKARRVKPGVRLLAHGVPARVAKLRALGNAIDLRPATAFIKAVM